jgi:hypothetical protein
MADYFDEYVANIPQELRYRQTQLPEETEREMMAFLLQSPWLEGMQKYVEQKAGKLIPRDELLNEMMYDTDYDYGGAYLARGEDMFQIDPASGTFHGMSRTPTGQWLKSPDHPTTWKEIFYGEMGYSPDPAMESPHPNLTREQAARALMKR